MRASICYFRNVNLHYYTTPCAIFYKGFVNIDHDFGLEI